ncbi:Inx2 (predicted) [Pycnogonum litorale]
MSSIFSSFGGFAKRNEVQIDNSINRLHYKATVVLLVVLSLAVASGQYFGTPIKCKDNSYARNNNLASNNFLDSYCWTATNIRTGSANDARSSYHHWVYVILLLQAAMFYVPRWLFKIWEDKQIVKMHEKVGNVLSKGDEQKESTTILVQYLMEHKNNNRSLYTYSYFLYEALNFTNVVGQIFFVDRFLGNVFSTHGLKVVEFMKLDARYRDDPILDVFPRITKCVFLTLGASGDVQSTDVACVIPANELNEKIYVLLWFWFVLLSAMTGLLVLYRILLIMFPVVRLYALRFVTRVTPMNVLQKVSLQTGLEDWFILYSLSRNFDPIDYKCVMVEFSVNLKLRGEFNDSMATADEHKFIGGVKYGVAV